MVTKKTLLAFISGGVFSEGLLCLKSHSFLQNNIIFVFSKHQACNDSFNRHNTLKCILLLPSPFYRGGDFLRSHTSKWGQHSLVPGQAGSKAHILNYYVHCSLIIVIPQIVNSLTSHQRLHAGHLTRCWGQGWGGSGVEKRGNTIPTTALWARWT